MTHAPLPERSRAFTQSQQQQQYLLEEVQWLQGHLRSQTRPDDPLLLQRLHSFERLLLFTDEELLAPTAAMIVREREYLALAQAYGATIDIARRVSTGALPYARAVKSGLLRELSLWFRNFNTSGERHQLSLGAPILVGEIHCPLVEGATGELTVSSTKEHNIGLEISAAGFGGGGWTKETHYTNSSTVPVSAGHCVGLFAHLSGSYTAWTHLDTGDQILLVNVTGIGSVYGRELSTRPNYDPETHFCMQETSYVSFLTSVKSGHLSIGLDYDRVTPSSSASDPALQSFTSKWTTAREYHIKADIGGEDGKLPAGAVVEGTSRFVEEVEATLRLPANFDYIGQYSSARHLPQQWAADDT